ncbi:hypothetical protein D3C87_1915160 [compost metagenome]
METPKDFVICAQSSIRNWYAAKLNFSGKKLYPLVSTVFSSVKEIMMISTSGSKHRIEYIQKKILMAMLEPLEMAKGPVV